MILQNGKKFFIVDTQSIAVDGESLEPIKYNKKGSLYVEVRSVATSSYHKIDGVVSSKTDDEVIEETMIFHLEHNPSIRAFYFLSLERYKTTEGGCIKIRMGTI